MIHVSYGPVLWFFRNMKAVKVIIAKHKCSAVKHTTFCRESDSSLLAPLAEGGRCKSLRAQTTSIAHRRQLGFKIVEIMLLVGC